MQPTGAPAQSNLKPLVNNTRKRFQRVKNPMSYAGFNDQEQITFDQVGYCNRLILENSFALIDTAATPSTATSAALLGPWSLFKRITLNTNLGTATQYDCSGFGASIVQQLYERNVQLRTAYGTGDTIDPMYNYPVTGYAQNVAKTINFVIMIPIALNDSDQFSIGLLNLQAPEVSATLTCTTGAPTDALATADTLTLTGTTTVNQMYYEVPSPQANVEAPKRIMNRYIENRQPISMGGENIYTVQRQGKLLRMAHWVTTNGVLDTKTADVTAFQLVANTSDFVERKDALSFLVEHRIRYGPLGVPPGVFVWDFFNASMLVNRGGFRDVFDTQKISVIESRVELASNISLGANNNYLDTVRHLVQAY
jgi:hypothetical protein